MLKIPYLLTLILALQFMPQAKAQYSPSDSSYSKFYLGSTFFLLGNIPATNRPDFVQLNLGYRLTNKDVVSLELKTWKYAWSLGIPYGDNFEKASEKFPGYIREYGAALAYHRFWWKGFYTGIHVMGAHQIFFNEQGNKLQNGFQIFNTYRMGYHFKFFKDKFFFQPSLAITHRPYHTKMPADFAKLDNKWPKFFIGEPGLHFGFNF